MQSKRIMWAASALVLLAGCQKTPQSGQIVRFTAVSQPAVLTKVQYTGELSGGKERIDWKQGDAIRIYSEGATASNNNSYTWADYAVTADGSDLGAVSQAAISVTSAQGGLAWGSGTNTFYAIYPKPTAGDDPTTVRGTSGTRFNCTIPAAQEGTATSVKDLSDQSADINVYYPNASAYHLAYNSLTEPVADTPLEFDPAYTAFHISAGHKDGDPDITIKSVTLKAASGNAVAGDFTAYYGGPGWTFGCPAYASDSNDAVTFTFAGSNPVLSGTDKVEFVLYALPQDLTNLTLDFLVDVDGVGTNLHRKLDLKMAAAGTYHGHTYSAGDWLIFNKCNKSYIKGLLIPGSTWTIDGSTEIKMQESVADWVDDTTITPVEYGTSGIIFNATGLNQTGTGGKSFDFSLFAPAGKTWKVTARNASDGSVATDVVLKPETGSDSTGGVLSGTIGDPNPWIHFTADSGPAGNYYLTFSVDVDGTVYSIDSEVARGGWGPGKSYSYFSF